MLWLFKEFIDNDRLWQICSIVFGIIEIGVIICYFVWWTHPPEVVFVSDLLSQNVEYKAFMTVFVCVQLFFSFTYAYRHREHHGRNLLLRFLPRWLKIVSSGWILNPLHPFPAASLGLNDDIKRTQ